MGKRLIYGFLALLLILGGVLYWQIESGKSVFSGSRICNPEAYVLEFDYMNRKDEHTLWMKQGDELRVKLEIRRGRADVTVGMDGEAPIYRGNDAQTGEFSLMIPADGGYRIEFDARKAQGFALFEVRN